MDIDNLSLTISELLNEIRRNRIRIEELEKKFERNQRDTQEDFRDIKERLAKIDAKNMTTSLPIMVQRQSLPTESKMPHIEEKREPAINIMSQTIMPKRSLEKDIAQRISSHQDQQQLSSIASGRLNATDNSGTFAIREIRLIGNDNCSLLFEDVNRETIFCPQGTRNLRDFKEGDVVELKNFALEKAERIPQKFIHATCDVMIVMSELTSTRKNNTLSPIEKLKNIDDKWSDSSYLNEKLGYHMVLQFESSAPEWIKKKDINVTKANFKTKDSHPVEITVWEQLHVKFEPQKFYVIKYCNVNNTAPRIDRKRFFHTTPTTVFREVCLSPEYQVNKVMASLPMTTHQTNPAATSQAPILIRLSQLKTTDPSSQTYAVNNVRVLQESCTMPDGEVHIAINDESTSMEKVVLKVQNGPPVRAGMQMQIENCQILQTKDLVTLISHRDHVKIGDTEVVIKEIPSKFMRRHIQIPYSAKKFSL